MEVHKTMLQQKDALLEQVWRSYAVAAIGFSLLLLAIFYQTIWSMVQIWWRSETFAHGFLIFPIAIWLIWGRRSHLSRLRPAVEFKAIIVLLVAGGLWLMGYLVDALVVQQFALIMLIIAGVWMILGSRVTWVLSFPLAYLFFAVPVGEDLVPPLMEFTATFTVELLRLTGIPVYREGLFFSLPSGNWSVVEACSGVRYLIASVTLGCLYAYLTYRSLLKRIIFIAFAIVIPILANGLRAYIIVMLGHLSDMTIATGVDHLIYGWLFFGLVIFLMFAIGAIWHDAEVDEKVVDEGPAQTTLAFSPSEPYKAGAIALLVVGLWPMLAQMMDSRIPSVSSTRLSAPASIENWAVTEKEAWQWRPMSLGADKRVDRFYQKGERRILLSVGQYIAQQQGEEMVNTQNLLVSPDLPGWRVTGSGKSKVRLQGSMIELDATRVSGKNEQLLVWSWFRVDANYTANPYIAKLYEALAKLSFSKRGGARIVVAIEYDNDVEAAAEELEQFVHSILPALENALDRVTDSVE